MSIRVRKSAIIVWIVLVALGSLLAFVVRGAGPLPGDLLLAKFLQDLPPGGRPVALLYNADSVVWFLLVVALAVALFRQRWLAALFVFLASFTAVLMGVALKLTVARPRPSAELVRVYDPSQTYSFPSITALFSLVLLGVIIYLISRVRLARPLLVVAFGASSMLIVALGLARVYTGEHWASDVLGGWIFGGALLLVLVAIHHRIHQRWVSGREGLQEKST